MAGSPSEEEIMAAIEASGYLMEQEVATQLERRGLHVRTNVAFEDSEEGKSREIDVTAITRVAVDETEKVGALVELLVECKNTANPFVFIARPKNEADRRRSLSFPTNTRCRRTWVADEAPIDLSLLSTIWASTRCSTRM